MSKRIKTEHAGAKNGGGYWGRRAEAKAVSRSIRRKDDKKAARERADDASFGAPPASP